MGAITGGPLESFSIWIGFRSMVTYVDRSYLVSFLGVKKAYFHKQNQAKVA